MPVRIISLKPLYDFVLGNQNREEALNLRHRKSEPYRDRCDELASHIEETRGFYLWGCYDKKGGLWRNIYLGEAGYGRGANLRRRILSELKGERCVFWRRVHTKEVLFDIGPRVHPDKKLWKKRIQFQWERFLHKTGATHIAWVPAPRLSNEDVKRVEADLIEAMNPVGNQQRPAPPQTVQQEDTAQIFRQFRQSVHAARDTGFRVKLKG